MNVPVQGKSRNIFIEFNGTQILVRTDVTEIAQYVLKSHSALVVPRAVELVGRVEVFHSATGYSCRGVNALEVPGEVSQLFDWMSREILDQFIRRHDNLLWIHAGVASREGQALVIVGPSAQGKSTLVTLLTDLGWHYLSDEVAPIRMSTGEVLPYPRTPVRRLDPGRAVSGNLGDVLESEMCPLSPGSVSRSPSTIQLIVFPRFSYGSKPKVTEMSPGVASLELARNCTNFSDLRNAAVARVASLGLATRCYWMDYGNGAEGVQMLDHLASTHCSA